MALAKYVEDNTLQVDERLNNPYLNLSPTPRKPYKPAPHLRDVYTPVGIYLPAYKATWYNEVQQVSKKQAAAYRRMRKSA